MSKINIYTRTVVKNTSKANKLLFIISLASTPPGLLKTKLPVCLYFSDAVKVFCSFLFNNLFIYLFIQIHHPSFLVCCQRLLPQKGREINAFWPNLRHFLYLIGPFCRCLANAPPLCFHSDYCYLWLRVWRLGHLRLCL